PGPSGARWRRAAGDLRAGPAREPDLAAVGRGRAVDLRGGPSRGDDRTGRRAPGLLGDDAAAAIHPAGGAVAGRGGARAPPAAGRALPQLATGIGIASKGETMDFS